MSYIPQPNYVATPDVTVIDNRGLAVRDIVYHRHPDLPDVTSERITLHQYDARGFLKQSVDPRLSTNRQQQNTVRPNFAYLTTLSGTVLTTDSVDAGLTMLLSDVAGRPYMAVSATGVTRCWQYETSTSSGRPLSMTEQSGDSSLQVIERFVYAGHSKAEKDLNLAGQCVRHYDTAGLTQIHGMALTGGSLSESRQLLPDNVEAQWQGECEFSWMASLNETHYTTRRTMDAVGRVLTTTDTAGNVQRVAYDVSGLLSGSWLKVKGRTEQVIVQSLTYSAAGQILREEHGNGVVTTYTYEPETQRLIGTKTERPVGHASDVRVLQDLRYDYDPVGNVLSIKNDAEETRFWRNQKVVPENRYVYDSLYQLVRTTGREIASAGQQGSLPSLTVPLPTDSSAYTNYLRTYAYDSAGNLTQIRHSAPATNNGYTTDITVSNRSNRGVLSALTKKTADVDALFTAGGQQKQLQPGQQLLWTPRNELLKVSPVQRHGSIDDQEYYRYDSSSQRVQKVSTQKSGNSIQTQRVIYLPGLERRTTVNGSAETEDFSVIIMREASRAQVRVLCWERGKPEGIDNDQIRWSHNSLFGNSVVELDKDGNIISMEEYYPYGGTAVWAAGSHVECNYKTIRYSGKELDATGLYYYGYRYYQPWAGRWLSTDPASTVDGLNLFRMVRNNPVTLRDDNGLLTFEDNYSDSEGGMIYGLSQSRSEYIRKINPSFSIANNNDTLVIDKYNNALGIAIMFGEHSEKQNSQINEAFFSARQGKAQKKLGAKIRIPGDIKDVVKKKFDHSAFKWDDYFAPGEDNPKFNIENIYRQVAKIYGTDYFHNYQMASKGYVVPRLLWKRGSKQGIEMAARGKNIIHFVLDGINMQDVVSKEGEGGASVTASELRYAFRNRERLNGRLFFYENHVLTPAPWESNDKLWGNYSYHPVERSRDSRFLSTFTKCFKAN